MTQSNNITITCDYCGKNIIESEEKIQELGWVFNIKDNDKQYLQHACPECWECKNVMPLYRVLRAPPDLKILDSEMSLLGTEYGCYLPEEVQVLFLEKLDEKQQAIEDLLNTAITMFVAGACWIGEQDNPDFTRQAISHFSQEENLKQIVDKLNEIYNLCDRRKK